MAGKREEVRATIKGKLAFDSDFDRALLFYTMRLFKDAVEMAHNLIRKQLKKNEIVKLLTSRILNNKWYSVSAYMRAKLYENQPHLKLRKPLLYSLGSSDENGNRNIKLIKTSLVKIKIPSADGKHKWIECKVKFSKKHLPVIQDLIEEKTSYSVGISLNDMNFILYINVPVEVYVDKAKKTIKSKSIPKHFVGFDFNPDRINMVIIDENGEIRDIKNAHFHEVISHGFSKDKAKQIRQEFLVKLVKYAREHGVRYFVVEQLKKPEPRGSKKAKRKISKMALMEYLNQMKILVRKVGGKLIKVNPAYTSIDAIPISKKLGIDIHTASAYLIALRGLRLIKTHKIPKSYLF